MHYLPSNYTMNYDAGMAWTHNFWPICYIIVIFLTFLVSAGVLYMSWQTWRSSRDGALPAVPQSQGQAEDTPQQRDEALPAIPPGRAKEAPQQRDVELTDEDDLIV